jgi:thiol-disulfide isomerase/thioredoxin
MDACYVHLALKYYCTGGADWVKQEDLDKICDNARRLEPILIGKIAPNIIVKNNKDQPVSLWDVDSDYTVLFFWAPDCSHCKKSAPFMVGICQTLQRQGGVKVFNVCTAVTDKGPECWKGRGRKGIQRRSFYQYLRPLSAKPVQNTVRRAIHTANFHPRPQTRNSDEKGRRRGIDQSHGGRNAVPGREEKPGKVRALY